MRAAITAHSISQVRPEGGLDAFSRHTAGLLKTTGVAAAVLIESSLLGGLNLHAAGPYVRRNVAALPASHPILVSYRKAINNMRARHLFLPLVHRMYLWYFERIVRKMSGNPHWALPFWNYEPVSARKVPLPFRSPAVATNQLYTVNRGPGWNAGTSALSNSAVDASAAMALVPFSGPFGFSDSLEGTPHAAVHVSMTGSGTSTRASHRR